MDSVKLQSLTSSLFIKACACVCCEHAGSILSSCSKDRVIYPEYIGYPHLSFPRRGVLDVSILPLQNPAGLMIQVFAQLRLQCRCGFEESPIAIKQHS